MIRKTNFWTNETTINFAFLPPTILEFCFLFGRMPRRSEDFDRLPPHGCGSSCVFFLSWASFCFFFLIQQGFSSAWFEKCHGRAKTQQKKNLVDLFDEGLVGQGFGTNEKRLWAGTFKGDNNKQQQRSFLISRRWTINPPHKLRFLQVQVKIIEKNHASTGTASG